MFMKVLIANRGEIAVRLMRACHEHDVATVAVYADCDRQSPHVRYAGQAVALGANEPAHSYLCVEKILAAAHETGADAIHPGYGFLAENASFARAVTTAGLTFIGPSAEVIDLMGGKVAARSAAASANFPTVPGTEGVIPEDASESGLQSLGDAVGYPLFVKAVAGGGGKGMRLVRTADLLLRAIESARSEATSAFGNGAVYLERCIEQGRHIEVQVLADHHGTVVPFVERECSIQRRHQKVIEESPSPVITEKTRRDLAEAAIRLVSSVGYTNAGTIECLYDERSEEFYFLEMNTRLQVEHPVTEMVTGIDLVRWQLRIAQGEPLTIDPERALTPDGHAFECRVYAEDPAAGFLPSPGLLETYREPAGPGIRVDAGVEAGFEVPMFYDSMVSKVISHAVDRRHAIARMVRALSEYEISGVPTTVPLFKWLLEDADFVAGRFDTTYLDRVLEKRDGASFMLSTDDPLVEQLVITAAAISVAVNSAGSNSSQPNSDESSKWRRAARIEGLE
jgi:acetyl-CoA carboxylase biotin carboxylase subunit